MTCCGIIIKKLKELYCSLISERPLNFQMDKEVNLLKAQYTAEFQVMQHFYKN